MRGVIFEGVWVRRMMGRWGVWWNGWMLGTVFVLEMMVV